MREADRHSDLQLAHDARAWTRWWWFGSCVTEAEITRQLAALRDAGFGGVEIQPIYAPVDPPLAPIPYLSPAWMRMLEHTLLEARRFGLGIDLTMGSGWPWGGPWVGIEHAARKLVVEREGGRAVARSVPTGQQVKRAGPGGEGAVADPYSLEAVREFLAGFQAPLASLGSLRPEAAFTDSFEVFEADHTPGLRAAFRVRRGYDPEPWLDRLDGDDDLGRRLRVPHGVLEARNAIRLRVLVVEANRIIDLERRGVPWRTFFFVNGDYGEFDASSWAPLPVGLAGPVTLKPA